MNRVKQKKPVQQPRADATRRRILKAARKEFVQHGYAGTSTITIAEKAKVHHSLVFHHFKDKHSLWQAVKQSIVEEAESKSPILPDLQLPWHEFLRQLITNQINFYHDYPEIISMINWQRIEYLKDKHRTTTQSVTTERWLKAIKHYQQTAEINPNLSAKYVLTMLLSIISSAAMDPYIYIKSDEEHKAYIDFCVDRLVQALG